MGKKNNAQAAYVVARGMHTLAYTNTHTWAHNVLWTHTRNNLNATNRDRQSKPDQTHTHKHTHQTKCNQTKSSQTKNPLTKENNDNTLVKYSRKSKQPVLTQQNNIKTTTAIQQARPSKDLHKHLDLLQWHVDDVHS